MHNFLDITFKSIATFFSSGVLLLSGALNPYTQSLPKPASAIVAVAPSTQNTGSMVSSVAPGSTTNDPVPVSTPQAKHTATAPIVAPHPTAVAINPINNVAVISKSYVDDQIQILRNSLSSEIFRYSSAQFPNAPGISQSTANLAVSQRIDQLTGTSLSNITVSGVSGLTAGDIPTDIVAGNYLPLTGGTLSGAMSVGGLSTLAGLFSTASSTIGNGTATGGLTVFGTATTTGNAYFASSVGIGTTSPLGTLSINAAAGQTPFIIGSSTRTTFVVNHLGNTTIGTTSPITDVLGASHAGVRVLNDGGTAAIMLQSYRDAGNHSKVWGFAARGTASNPQPVQGGDSLLELTGSAWDGTAFRTTAQIIFTQESNASSGIVPSYIDFRTTPTGSLSSVEVARISSAGNVGIGTTSPYAKLSVKGAGSTTGVNFQTTNSSNSPLFTILDSGLVGIGTTSPQFRLSLAGSAATLATGPNIEFYDTSGDSNSRSWAIGNSFSTNYGDLSFAVGAAAGAHVVSGGNVKMTLDKSGNLGIGTTTPTNTLAVHGTSYVSGTSFFGGAITATSTLTVNGASTLTGAVRADAGVGVGVATNNAFTAYTTSVNAIYGLQAYNMNTGGTAARAGVAMNNFNYNAHMALNGTGYSTSGINIADGLTLQNGAPGGVQIGSTNAAGDVSLWTNSLNRLTVAAAGNVGIGTTSPRGKLEVAEATDSAFYTSRQTSNTISLNFADANNSVITSRFIGYVHQFYNSASTIAAGTETMRITSTGNVGIGTTSPWRTLGVTGTVGFDGLTGSTGAGSLCLSANKEVVYNSGSDSCLSSTRATKHDIVEIGVSGSTIIGALQPVSFIYNNDASSTVRYGFIAEDTAAVDAHLATYDAQGAISGIDDRSIISILVKALKELLAQVQALASVVAGFADSFTTKHVQTEQLCVGSTCITETELKALLEERSISAQSANGSSGGSSESGDTATSTPDTTPPVITLSGANPAQIEIDSVYIDLGAIVTDNVDQNLGVHAFVGSTPFEQAFIDTSTTTTYHINYVAIDAASNTATSTRTVIVGE